MTANFATGLHMSNIAISDEDVRLFLLSGAAAAKLLWLHRPSDVERIRAVRPDSDIVVRLPDFPIPLGYQDLPGKYADTCFSVIGRFYPSGVRVFQVDNEPNWTWAHKPNGPWSYQYYMRLSMQLLRAKLTMHFPDVELIAPPVSWSPGLWNHDEQNPTDWTLDEWREVYAYSGGPLQGQSLWSFFDYAAANCYWQDPPVPAAGRRLQMTDGSFGGSFTAVHSDSALPVYLTEAGNSWADRKPTPQAAECYAAMTAQYPVYVRWLRTFDYVRGVFFFILGGSNQWTGFQVTEPTCQAIRRG